MVMKYDPAIIDPGLADLDARGAGLRAANDDVRAASDKLMAIWQGAAADAFVGAKQRWDGEFETLAEKLSNLVRRSHEAKEAALASDAQAAAGFGG